MNPFQSNIIGRLSSSIKDLETAVESCAAKAAASKGKDNHPILNRIDEYKILVSKQKQYVLHLSNALNSEDCDEVFRIIQIINGISSMIRDDAREVMAKMHGIPQEEKILH